MLTKCLEGAFSGFLMENFDLDFMSLHPAPLLHSTLIPELELLLETFGSAETSVCTERLRYFNANLH